VYHHGIAVDCVPAMDLVSGSGLLGLYYDMFLWSWLHMLAAALGWWSLSSCACYLTALRQHASRRQATRCDDVPVTPLGTDRYVLIGAHGPFQYIIRCQNWVSLLTTLYGKVLSGAGPAW